MVSDRRGVGFGSDKRDWGDEGRKEGRTCDCEDELHMGSWSPFRIGWVWNYNSPLYTGTSVLQMSVIHQKIG